MMRKSTSNLIVGLFCAAVLIAFFTVGIMSYDNLVKKVPTTKEDLEIIDSFTYRSQNGQQVDHVIYSRTCEGVRFTFMDTTCNRMSSTIIINAEEK